MSQPRACFSSSGRKLAISLPRRSIRPPNSSPVRPRLTHDGFKPRMRRQAELALSARRYRLDHVKGQVPPLMRGIPSSEPALGIAPKADKMGLNLRRRVDVQLRQALDWMLVALAASALVSCASARCGTEGAGGKGPGGCGFDVKFSTSDSLTMPGSSGEESPIACARRAASIFPCGASSAQTPVQPAPDATTPAPEGTPSAKAPARATTAPNPGEALRRKTCRQQVDQSLKGPDLNDAMQICMAEAWLNCLKQAVGDKVRGKKREAFMSMCSGSEAPKE
jgi:hypothetical protein